jgi:hypothetical protein
MIAITRTLATVTASVFAVAALAGQAGSRNDGSRPLQLKEPAVLLGVTVVPGTYTLRWARERGSEDVRVEIARGRDVLASGNGRWIETVEPSPYEALVYHGEGGTKELAQIRFKSSVDAIRIDGGAMQAGAGQPHGAAAN